MKFHTGYMDGALFNLRDAIDAAHKRIGCIDFDTMIGTGFSGGIVIPALALSMDKKFALIRKDGDDSHHGAGRILGDIGSRWIFVDDFVSSGRTRQRVLDKVADEVGGSAVFVGSYLYECSIPWMPELPRAIFPDELREE